MEKNLKIQVTLSKEEVELITDMHYSYIQTVRDIDSIKQAHSLMNKLSEKLYSKNGLDENI